MPISPMMPGRTVVPARPFSISGSALRRLPGALLADVEPRPPIGAWHPLWIAEAVARLGGRPTDPRSLEEHEAAVVALL